MVSWRLRRRVWRGGVTLVELLAAVVIMLILAALISAGWETIARQAARTKCLSNMRNLHVALANYVADAGHWPQIPPQVEDDLKTYEEWWIAALQPFGAGEKSWKCPVLESRAVKDADGYRLRMHYIPTDFDANPISPSRWPAMPWLIERGNNHGNGALVDFPDGSIRSSLR